VLTTNETRVEISRLIGLLESSFLGKDAFSPQYSDLLLRNAEVVYVGQSSSKKANAAGGKYRGRIGRFVFQTDALFQHVLEGSKHRLITVACCWAAAATWAAKPTVSCATSAVLTT